MKMYKRFLLLAVVMFGVMYSNAFGKGLNAHPVQVSPTLQAVQDVNQFDINGEIAAIRNAKAVRDNAIKNCNGDAQTINLIMQQYENIKNQRLENIKNRRLAQYMQGFLVTRYGHAWAFDGEGSFDGDYRIDCPNPAEWVMIPGSGHWVENGKRVRNFTDGLSGFAASLFKSFPKNYIEINQAREENNGYTVHIHVNSFQNTKNARVSSKVDSYIDFTIAARYRYNDAIIARMLDNDMTCFRNRIEMAVK